MNFIQRARDSSLMRWVANKPVVLVIAAFVASRLYYYRLGIRFDDTTIDIVNQILSRQLLHDRLLETAFYSHGQSPLLGIVIGLVLNISALPSSALFTIIFLGLGLLLSISLYNVMIYLRLPPSWAVGVPASKSDFYLILFLGIPISVLMCSGLAIHLWRGQDPRAPVLLRMVFTCWFVSIANCLFDFSENNRYRYESDPVLMVFAALAAWYFYGWLRPRFKRNAIELGDGP